MIMYPAGFVTYVVAVKRGSAYCKRVIEPFFISPFIKFQAPFE